MGKGLQMALHNGALPWDAQSCPIPTSHGSVQSIGTHCTAPAQPQQDGAKPAEKKAKSTQTWGWVGWRRPRTATAPRAGSSDSPAGKSRRQIPEQLESRTKWGELPRAVGPSQPCSAAHLQRC